jgi:cell division protein FtsL
MQDPTTLTRERRYIYNGEPGPSVSGYAVRPNRRPTQRRMSTFTLVLLLFGLGLAIVAYINNILAVNQLAKDVGHLAMQLDTVKNTNVQLRAGVAKKMARERITAIATEELGMQYADSQAVDVEVDQDKSENLK